jgi:S-adenosylmethionine-diacylglycerol 3-amino-3-carboxypropyl transferase
LFQYLSSAWFRAVHRHQLVYNTCWEDPRLDHVALRLTPQDSVFVITSAGCNVLDYALAEPRRIHAVDLNPRQNALLELKLAGIRALDYERFFDLFGRGRCSGWDEIYGSRLRPHLSASAQACWDRHGAMFVGAGPRSSFYYRGSAGFLAWLANFHIDRIAKIRDGIWELLTANSVQEQREIFEQHRMTESLWHPLVRWAVRRDFTLALLGVPRRQRQQIDRDYPGGIVQFIVDRIEAVFTRLTLRDNYFWRVYLTGCYSSSCCPEYLKPDKFERLKNGLIDCIKVHTTSAAEFLEQGYEPISRFVLLDHQDWLYAKRNGALQREWQAIVHRATPNARIIWRSAGLDVDFVDPLTVQFGGQECRVGELLDYETELATRLHAQDRVHTYGSFHIAQLAAA